MCRPKWKYIIIYKKRQYHPVELCCKILFSSLFLFYFIFFAAFSFTQFSRSNDGLHPPLPSARPLQPRREYDLTTASVRVQSPPRPFTVRFHRASVQVRPECGWAGSGCSPWQHRSRTPSPPPLTQPFAELEFPAIATDPSPCTATRPYNDSSRRDRGCFFIV